MGGFAPQLFRAPSLRGGKESQLDANSQRVLSGLRFEAQ